MGYDFNDYKKDAMDRPSSKAWSNWASFEKVGDSAQGYIRDVFYRKEEGIYKAARGITLEQPDGTLINVSIKRHDFILEKTDNLRLGDPLTVVLEAELAPKKAGHNPTKQYGFYGKNLPENAANKTVKQLEDEDMGNGGQSDAANAAEAKAQNDEFAGVAAAPVTSAPTETSPSGDQAAQ